MHGTETPSGAPPNAAQTTLKNLCRYDVFQAQYPELFPSVQAINYYVRRWRSELTRRGAIVMMNRSPLINAPVFCQAFLEIGAMRAEKLLAEGQE